MQRHLWVWALCLQIVLAIAAPPISLGERSLFLSDLWFFVWVPLSMACLFRALPTDVKRRFLFRLGGVGILGLIIYAHGAMRVSMMPALLVVNHTPPDDHFQAGRELVVALRFLSWVWGAMTVAEWYNLYRVQLREDLKMIQRTLAVMTLIAVASLIAAKLSPSVGQLLGKIYGYNPDFSIWWDRVYGVFRSPVEGSMTLGFSLLFLLAPEWSTPVVRRTCLVLLILGIVLTKTISTLTAAIFSFAILAFFRIRKTFRWVFAFVFTAIFGVGLWLASGTDLYAQKKGNFLFRMLPWKILANATGSRWDTFLFGTGFNPHYVDNIYLFIFNRGGLLLLLATAFAIGASLVRNWHDMGWQQRAVLLTLMMTGITFDNVIIRPVAMLLVVVGTPLLCIRTSD